MDVWRFLTAVGLRTVTSSRDYVPAVTTDVTMQLRDGLAVAFDNPALMNATLFELNSTSKVYLRSSYIANRKTLGYLL